MSGPFYIQVILLLFMPVHGLHVFLFACRTGQCQLHHEVHHSSSPVNLLPNIIKYVNKKKTSLSSNLLCIAITLSGFGQELMNNETVDSGSVVSTGRNLTEEEQAIEQQHLVEEWTKMFISMSRVPRKGRQILIFPGLYSNKPSNAESIIIDLFRGVYPFPFALLVISVPLSFIIKART